MTLSARIARAESRVPQAAPTVTVVRRFYTPCPVCRRHGGARVRHVRENDLAAPADAWTRRAAATPDGGPPGCGALLVNRAAWDYYEWCEAHPPADPHALPPDRPGASRSPSGPTRGAPSRRTVTWWSSGPGATRGRRDHAAPTRRDRHVAPRRLARSCPMRPPPRDVRDTPAASAGA
jgi:hypothetical protein